MWWQAIWVTHHFISSRHRSSYGHHQPINIYSKRKLWLYQGSGVQFQNEKTWCDDCLMMPIILVPLQPLLNPQYRLTRFMGGAPRSSFIGAISVAGIIQVGVTHHPQSQKWPNPKQWQSDDWWMIFARSNRFILQYNYYNMVVGLPLYRQ